MIALVLVYCLIADTKNCTEKRQQMEFQMTPAACLVHAQQVALEYVQAHPQWRLAEWRCESEAPGRHPS